MVAPTSRGGERLRELFSGYEYVLLFVFVKSSLLEEDGAPFAAVDGLSLMPELADLALLGGALNFIITINRDVIRMKEQFL